MEILQYKLAGSHQEFSTTVMGLQVKVLVIWALLQLPLSFCESKNDATVKVDGLIHCTECIKNQSTSSNSSLGLDVFIVCPKTQGNGAITQEGKFTVTLSSPSSSLDPSSIDGCYAKLRSHSGAPCPIRSNQTASIQSTTNTVKNRPTIIKFSPITCQSAIFWPFPNFTFFDHPPPPAEYTSPPPDDLDLPPLSSPVEPPLPPLENLPPVPEPSYDPEFGAPSLSPEVSFGSPPAPAIETPSIPPQASPPIPVYADPSPPLPPPPVIDPIPAPTPPNPRRYTPRQTPPPTPAVVVSAPPPSVDDPIPVSTPPSPPRYRPRQTPPPTPAVVVSTPPRRSAGISRRRPSPIPRAPPIPRLPLTPGAPRKYFNAPKSKTKPPRFT